MKQKFPIYFHTSQLEFHPKYEWALGNRIKHPETTRRAESIFKAIKKNKNDFEILEPPRIPLKAIREAHNYQLMTLYNTATTLKDDEAFYPSVFPQRMKAKPDPTNIYHAGFYCFDSGTPLNNKTWLASAWSAASAYYAADSILKNKSFYSYALSRPPGHHASRDTYGGYCYFNNAAIAARLLKKQGRIVIIDIDFHHGNGTQEMFYRDDNVFVISIHGDPRKHFPYFCGFPHEIGQGKGEGYNLNIILEDNTGIKTYIKTLKETVLPVIKRYEPSYLVLSAGFDTYELDPIGNFKLKTEDFYSIGRLFKSLKIPTVILQEGGYHTKDLGKNVVSLLNAFI
jgi:acetoin utilization deacetylase AcuC-like enzyme